MGAFVERIIQFIVDQGALGVFVASALEEIIVPIPSTVIQTGAGFLFLSGLPVDAHSLWILLSRIVIPSAVGATLGSLLIYGLVYWGGMPFVRRFGRYFFITPSKVERAKETVLAHRSLVWAFCILRFIPLLPNVFVAAGAGFIRLPVRIYLWTSLVGIAVRATYLGLAGWLAGGAFEALVPQGTIFGMFIALALGILAVTVIVGLVIVYVRKKKKR